MGHLFFEDLLNYLQAIGFDFEAAPESVNESWVTNPEVVIRAGDRDLSVDYLFKLIMTQRVWDVLSRDGAQVLELGAGMGSFARVAKNRNPSIRYVILDLFETMVLSYCYLRLEFQDAKFQFIYDKTQLSNIDLDNDFVFIAAEIFENVERMRFDLAVNTFSLGEMTQPMVERYMRLFEKELDVERFYSLNLYLQPERALDWHDEQFQMSNSTPVDPNWRVLHWEYCPPVIKQILHRGEDQYQPGGEPQNLELYLERSPGQPADPAALRQRSDNLLAEAEACGELRGARWHSLMWESIQLCPRPENVGPYHTFLKQCDMREQRYFGRLLRNMGIEVPEPYTKPVKPRPSRPRREVVSFLRLWTDRGLRVLEM